MKELYLLGLWVIFACASGIAEAILYHKLFNPNSKNIAASPEAMAAGHWNRLFSFGREASILVNEHFWFTVTRLCMWFGLFHDDLWNGIVAILCFPFFHDGMLYTFRNWINPLIYHKRWWAQPMDGGSAEWDLSVGGRVTFFLLGLMLYLVFWVIS